MSEPIVDILPNTNPIELRHGPNYDIVLNRDAANQSVVDSLARSLSDGLPATWRPYRPPGGSTRNSFYVDNLDIPTYIAKERAFSVVNRAQGNPSFSSSLASIFHEFSISPRIKQTLDGEDARAFAGRHNLHPIEFVEPLIGLIDGKSGKEITVYRFVPGAGGLEATKHLGRAADFLRGLFLRNGIVPGDMGHDQFIVHPGFEGRKIYLVDAEEFELRNAT